MAGTHNGDTATTGKFLWNGLRWSPALYLSRLTCVLAAIAVALLAALFFHRFDPAREWGLRSNKPPPPRPVAAANGEPAIAALPRPGPGHLSALPHKNGSPSAMPRLVLAELKLMLKGRRWWWYGIPAGLFAASVPAPLDAVRGGVAVAALIWPVLIWSQMGTREARLIWPHSISPPSARFWRNSCRLDRRHHHRRRHQRRPGNPSSHRPRPPSSVRMDSSARSSCRPSPWRSAFGAHQ